MISEYKQQEMTDKQYTSISSDKYSFKLVSIVFPFLKQC